MKKLWAVLVLCAAVFMAASALAEGPTGGMRAREYEPGALVPRAAYTVTPGKYTYEAGEPIVFNVTRPQNGYVNLDLGVLDNSYASANTADILWSVSKVTDVPVVYDLCWTPGHYVVWYEVWGSTTTSGGGSGMGPGTGTGTGTGTGGSSSGTPTKKAEGSFEFYVTACSGTNLLHQKVQQVVAANRGADDFETVINLHDWVLAHNAYDYSFTYYSAESLFFLESGVCNSYARAFDLLLKEAGIPSTRVGGCTDEYNPSTTGHAWSAAAIDGQWYLYDLTWDDDSVGFDGYLYCGLPRTLMDLEHKRAYFVEGTKSCTSLDSNYYVRSGNWQEYAPNSLSQFMSQVAEGKHRNLTNIDTYYDYSNSTAKNRIYRNVIAAAYTATTWTDVLGGEFRGTFTLVSATGSKIAVTLQGRGDLVLPNDITVIEPGVFEGIDANFVTVNSACTEIGSGAFRNAHVWEIRIGANVTNIADDAFDGLPKPYLLIIAPSGSYAARWATQHGYATATR